MVDGQKDTKLSLVLLDSIIICGQCGALFLGLGWSNSTHLAWHEKQASMDAGRES